MTARLSSPSRQRGMTFLGMLFVGIVVAFTGVVAAQVFPTYLEFIAAEKAIKKASASGGTVAEIRRTFENAAAIDDITSLKPADLEVTKQGDKVVVSFAYNKEIHLAGPAYLVMKYTATTR